MIVTRRLTFIFGFVMPLLNLCNSHDSILNLSEEKTSAVDKLRGLVRSGGKDVHDYWKLDGYLARILSANKWNADDAFEMFQKAQRWRKENQIDSILNETILQFPQPVYDLDGVDKEGRPVLVIRLLNFRTLILQGKGQKVVRYFLQMTERFELKKREISSLHGQDLFRGVTVHDLDGYNLKEHGCLACLAVHTELTQIGAMYYPESGDRHIFINVPRSAKPYLDINRNLMPAGSMETLHVFGTNKTEWSNFLLTKIPKDQLSFKYGGNRN